MTNYLDCKGMPATIIGTDSVGFGVTAGKTGKSCRILGTGVPAFVPVDGSPSLILIVEPAIGARPGARCVLKREFIASVIAAGGTLDESILSTGIASLRLVPLGVHGKPVIGRMFGGHFAFSCDSRFPSDTPIPIHDRQEG